MCIFGAVLVSVVLVTLGYLSLWTASHENTSKSLAGFGRVMAVILFVFSGLVLLFGAVRSFSPCGHSMMMRHCCMMKEDMESMGGCKMEGMHHDMIGVKENEEKINEDKPVHKNEMKNKDMKEMKNK